MSLILNYKIHKYAKISCSAYVDASIFFTVKPLFIFLENVLFIWQGMTKKKKSLPKGDSFGFLCWKSPCRSDRPHARANIIMILRGETTCTSCETRFINSWKLRLTILVADN